MVVSNGFDRIQRPYSIIGEFGTHISAGIKYGVRGICKTVVVLNNPPKDTFPIVGYL